MLPRLKFTARFESLSFEGSSLRSRDSGSCSTIILVVFCGVQLFTFRKFADARSGSYEEGRGVGGEKGKSVWTIFSGRLGEVVASDVDECGFDFFPLPLPFPFSGSLGAGLLFKTKNSSMMSENDSWLFASRILAYSIATVK